MSPGELGWRVREQALRSAWSRRQVRPGSLPPGRSVGAGWSGKHGFDGLRVLPGDSRRFSSVLPPGAADRVPSSARAAVAAAADRILAGEWEMLGVVRTDMQSPDWFCDPVTGRRSDQSRYCFRVNPRSEAEVGNVKQVWEVSRLQHLTLLACAYYLTGTEAYAARAAEQLAAWCRANPFLSGVNWTSGIEVGLRLLNFAWIRRLLSSWPGVRGLFEESSLFLWQLRWHQEYLAAFESRGSSANNHVIAEAAGQLAASCAFPWFAESPRWRASASSLLARSLAANTFPSGINRELASDYHGFVFELGAYAVLEALVFGGAEGSGELAGSGELVDGGTWRLLCSMADCMAALVDVRCRPPRQGDSDEGRVVLLDAPAHNRWPELLSVGSALFGALDWWPETPPSAASVLVGALSESSGALPRVAGRLGRRPSRFADAGVALLRTEPGAGPEIWVRCDGGPHGFLSIAAHAHADALSAEVRHDGVDILADPGTYCYHGDPEWRSYFRSTLAHNTVEIGGVSQSADGGPFLWLRHARTRELSVSDTTWTAEHDGYAALRPPGRHRRTVRLDPAARAVEITDALDGAGHEIRVAFHLGPDVAAELDDGVAVLSWQAPGASSGARPGAGVTPSGVPARRGATLTLPAELTWRACRGETGAAGPIGGWYSPAMGQRVPAVTLLGTGRCAPGMELVSRLRFGGEDDT